MLLALVVLGEDRFEPVEVDEAFLVHGQADLRQSWVGAPRQLVRVVLEDGVDHRGLDVGGRLVTQALGHEIDGLGGIGGEHDLVGRLGRPQYLRADRLGLPNELRVGRLRLAPRSAHHLPDRLESWRAGTVVQIDVGPLPLRARDREPSADEHVPESVEQRLPGVLVDLVAQDLGRSEWTGVVGRQRAVAAPKLQRLGHGDDVDDRGRPGLESTRRLCPDDPPRADQARRAAASILGSHPTQPAFFDRHCPQAQRQTELFARQAAIAVGLELLLEVARSARRTEDHRVLRAHPQVLADEVSSVLVQARGRHGGVPAAAVDVRVGLERRVHRAL